MSNEAIQDLQTGQQFTIGLPLLMEEPTAKIRSRYFVGGRDNHLLPSPTDKVFSPHVTRFKKDKLRFI